MNMPTQTPAKLTFEKPVIMNSNGVMISPGISLSIETTFVIDKAQLKKDLASIFAEVLEYFD